LWNCLSPSDWKLFAHPVAHGTTTLPMHPSLSTPAQWAQAEFASAPLGDRRRTARLVNIASHLAANPGGTLPAAFPGWHELKAAYRFFSQPRNGPEQILTPHHQRTLSACQEPGEFLLIEDTTDLDYTAHPATEGLGRIGDGRGRGLRLHTTLAVRVQAWDLEQQPEGLIVGLLSQQCTSPRPAPEEETRAQRLARPRQSQRWASVFDSTGGPPAKSQWIYIADREADFYEPLCHCARHGVDFIIRSYQDRRLADGTEHLDSRLARATVLGQLTLTLRARPGQSARKARVQVRAVTVTLSGPWRPGGRQTDFTVQALEVSEVATPEGITPLHWRLLTSLPCRSWAQVQRIIGRYAARWLVEEYHKAIKSGAGVEHSQMEQAHRLESLVAVLAVVAVRLLQSKLLAIARPDEAVSADALGPEALALLAGRYGKPAGGWTHRTVLVALARLGGFPARRGDGLPGWQTIWRGWHRLLWMSQGLATLQRRGKTCG